MGRNALLYYHTFFDENQSDALFVSPESIERMFRKGVDKTIECLCSPQLVSPEPATLGAAASAPAANTKPSAEKMVILLPGLDPVPELAKIGKETSLTNGAFVSLERGEVFEVGGFPGQL